MRKKIEKTEIHYGEFTRFDFLDCRCIDNASLTRHHPKSDFKDGHINSSSIKLHTPIVLLGYSSDGRLDSHKQKSLRDLRKTRCNEIHFISSFRVYDNHTYF